MHSGTVRRPPRAPLLLLLVCAIAGACSGGPFRPEYEYEEELYLSLDGSATLNVNASVASLVALRGADLDPGPRARIDRARVRALFEAPGAEAVRVSLSRRDGRRFVHVSVDIDDVRQASRIAPFAWSSYRFDRRDDLFEFRQTVGPPAGRPPADAGWTGEELVSFKMHLPSEIVSHNSAEGPQRGNILIWEQPLVERLKGTPLDLQVHIETESILFTTLLLFGSTVVAAALAFALVVWWIVRHGAADDGEMVKPARQGDA